MATLDEMIAAMSLEDQREVKEAAVQLVTHEYVCRAAGKAHDHLLKELKLDEAAVQHLEKQTDLWLSTVRHYVEEMGGKREVVAHFPDRPPLIIDDLLSITPSFFD
jgi:hypothetical protein